MSDEAIHLLGLPKSHAPIFMKRVSGRYYFVNNVHGFGALTTGAYAQNWIHAFPFPVESEESFDEALCSVNTLGAGSYLGLAIYKSPTPFLGKPDGGALLRDLGEFDLSTAGYKYLSISPILTLKRGIYWMAFQQSIPGAILNAKNYTTLLPWFGDSGFGAYAHTGCRGSCVWADFPPATFPSGTASAIYSNPVMLRVA